MDEFDPAKTEAPFHFTQEKGHVVEADEQARITRFTRNLVENVGAEETVTELLPEGEVYKTLRLFKPESWSITTENGLSIQLAIAGTPVENDKSQKEAMAVLPESLKMIALTQDKVAISLGSIHNFQDDITNLEDGITRYRKKLGYPVSNENEQLEQYAEDFDRDKFRNRVYDLYGRPTLTNRLGALAKSSLGVHRKVYEIGIHEANTLVNYAVAKHHLSDEFDIRIPDHAIGIYHRLTLEAVEDYFSVNGNYDRYCDINREKHPYYTINMSNHKRLAFWIMQHNHLEKYLSGQMFKGIPLNPYTISLAQGKFAR